MNCCVLVLLVLAAAAPAAAYDLDFDRSAPPDTVPDFDGFRTCLYREGPVHIAGQPTADALRALPARGFTLVVNLRTPKETDDRERVPFDEAALADSLVLEYVGIPLGGDDHPYTPAAVEALAAALERHPGRVLLHCTAGWRASHLWAAYLVTHHGFGVSEAYERGAAMGIGETPLAKMLDRPLTMIPAGDATDH